MAGKGDPKTGGRAKGTRNKATIVQELRAVAGIENAVLTGLLPLDVMLHRMRGTMPVTDEQFEAAVAAAPYLHPRLSAIAHTPTSDLERLTDDELRAEIARLEAGAVRPKVFSDQSGKSGSSVHQKCYDIT